MIRYLIRAEGGRLLTALILGLMAGSILDSLSLGIILALVWILGVHLYYASALILWLRAPKKNALPDGVGVWEDIYNLYLERRKQARKRKKRLAGIVREFRASTMALPDAAVVLNRDGCINWFNHAAESLLGLRGQEDLGLRITNLLRHPRFSSYYATADTASSGVEIPAPLQAERTLWVRVIPYGDGQSLFIARDITDLKQVEQSRRDFVANASHELRTPLTVLRGYLDMMGAEPQDGPLAPWTAPIGEMRRQAERMQNIIVDLLKLANLEATRARVQADVIDMPRLLQASLDEARVLSNGQHELQADIDERLRLRGHDAELQSIVGNLLSNALRYTPPGGRIQLSWKTAGDSAILSVTDSGIGIAAKDIPRLTERFYRSDAARSRDTGGTGLGLAIVKHALERHDATLSIQSRPGQGSTFLCRFPETRVTRT